MRPRLPLGVGLRLLAFRALEQASDLRGNSAASAQHPAPPAPARPAWWVFVSTIGELNAIAPLLDALCQRMASMPLVLITDHAHYRDSYLARYPDAEVFVTRGHSRDAGMLAAVRPPQLVVVAEIPLIPSDAPCRCSVAFLLHARARGARLVAVNGWLYGYQPSCRMDDIERRWLTRPLLEQFDALCVQTESVQQQLVAAGAPAARIHLTGNLKIDALRHARAWQVQDARSPALLQSLVDGARPAIVAGSLTRSDELQAVVQAFVWLRQQHPRALLVLAPRHPEVPANLDEIAALLLQHDLKAAWRSRLTTQAIPDEVGALVLDTMGELRDLYAAAAVAHVGVDHNVLEPLSYNKPTSVMSGWEQTYPSFPVYTALRDAGALLTADDARGLQRHWQAALQGQAATALKRVIDVLAGARTSLAQHLAALTPWLPLAEVER
ncbi:3-deoxy-D-manno-octulosonic acid transferase [Aquabacterium sp.]|uniref:3-deoxy-D-manno-octulosonic acid transferase n=1 Tax=Aquabacterium sp. TaxID=1872578 RepID=UPI002C9A0C66|nr:glycosyltransferase N-terminal domain-containing protein [Aquabacterium sp.]HSW03487.1 glycosyltransferase N-terminal domain-containing protein [Aquabacterium sp.]